MQIHRDGKQSSLGPTDPQIAGMPAYVAKRQFEQIHEEIIDNPNTALVWRPILEKFGASFLKQCDWAIHYAEDFVTETLKTNMLKSHLMADAEAKEIAETLGNLERNKGHGRRFHYMDCEKMKLKDWKMIKNCKI